MNHLTKGFTLIELMIVIAIVGIIAAIVIPELSAYGIMTPGTDTFIEESSQAVKDCMAAGYSQQACE